MFAAGLYPYMVAKNVSVVGMLGVGGGVTACCLSLSWRIYY